MKEAVGIVSEMAEAGILPTCETFNCLVNVCAKSARAGAGEKAVARARVPASALVSFPMTSPPYTSA